MSNVTPLHPEDTFTPRPNNEPAEQALLGAVLLNNQALERVEFLKPGHFYLPVHGRIFEACQVIAGRGQVADPVTLKAYFEADESLAGIGGVAYLMRLVEAAATVMNAGDYGRDILDCSVRRDLIALGEDVIARASKPTPDIGAMEMIAETEASLYTMAEAHVATSKAVGLGELADRVLVKSEEAFKSGRGMTGTATGIDKLDRMLNGLKAGRFYVIAARPGIGKTGLALQIAYKAATTPVSLYGGPVYFWQGEMPGGELASRQLAHLTGIPATLIENGQINARDFETLMTARRSLGQVPMEVDDQAKLTVAQIHNRARRLKRRGGLSMVLVDHLGLIRPSPHMARAMRVHQIEDITGSLKSMAKDLDVPVVAMSQLSRAVEQREDKRPHMGDLRDSGSIEQDADVVMFLYREEYYLKRSEPSGDDHKKRQAWVDAIARSEGMAEVILAKHRGGPTGKRDIHFDEPLVWFSDQPLNLMGTDAPADLFSQGETA